MIHFEFGCLAVGREYLSDLLNCRLSVSLRGYDLNYMCLEYSNSYSVLWEKADALHLLSEDLWKRAQSRGCPKTKFHTLIPAAIDTGFFNPDRHPHPDTSTSLSRHSSSSASPTKLPERSRGEGGSHIDTKIRILSVGGIECKNGYEFALQAVKLLCDKGVECEYCMIGDGEHLECITFARHELDLENIVTILRPQSKYRVKEEMQSADIFLHAAVAEGFCNAVIEAQAMELPVVCTDVNGLPENVCDGVTGFVVLRRDPVIMAEKLEILAKYPDLRKHMGKAGRKRVLKKFQLKDQIAKFTQFYEELIKQQVTTF